jgi:uridine phosphorylase
MNHNKINDKFKQLTIDYLYHLGLDTSLDLKAIFGNIKYVVFTRTNNNSEFIAQQLAKQWYKIENESFKFLPIFKTERFYMYKVGSVIVISHGFGMASMLICLNEISKLMAHLNVEDVTYIKVSACGGLGVELGSVIIADEVYNTNFEPFMYSYECGQKYKEITYLNQNVINNVHDFAINNFTYNIIKGKIVGTHDLFEEQGDRNSFLEPVYSQDELLEYFAKAEKMGVKGFDLESCEYAATCNIIEVNSIIINAVVADRYNNNYFDSSYLNYEKPALTIVTQYLLHKEGMI